MGYIVNKIWIHVFPALMNTLIENFCCGGYIYIQNVFAL